MKIKIDGSFDSFRQLRENGCYYVDKTEMLQEYLEERFKKAVLFTRPRRFGKTLAMTMFRDFLDIRQDSRSIFDGLKIMEHGETVEKYMNQYPVIFISLKEVFGDSYEHVFQNFQIAVSKLCQSYEFLLDSEKISSSGKNFLKKLIDQEANQPNTEQALDLLSSMLYSHYGKEVFIIIDEYDVPMAKALGHPFYDKVRDIVEHMLSYVCKTNDKIRGVILSGCLYTVKNSTYTGVNNIIPYSILNPIYDNYFGFTGEEVKKLLAEAGFSEQFDRVEKWYDGYIFGRSRMYCPWDVLLYVNSLVEGTYSDAMGPESYWANSSEASLNIVQGFLGKTKGVNEKFEQLLAGKEIDCLVNEYLPYHRIYEDGENIWSALLETGYLTKTVTEKMKRMPLRIPNREIQEVFRQEIWLFFKDRVDNAFISDFVNALWAGETQRAKKSLDLILEATLSFYHEYQEYSYHLILAGFFTGLGYSVFSELETGYGRSDLVVTDAARGRCIILELKHVKEATDMESALSEALDQMKDKHYDSRLIYQGYTTRIQYGMAFCDKNVIVEKQMV